MHKFKIDQFWPGDLEKNAIYAQQLRKLLDPTMINIKSHKKGLSFTDLVFK